MCICTRGGRKIVRPRKLMAQEAPNGPSQRFYGLYTKRRHQNPSVTCPWDAFLSSAQPSAESTNPLCASAIEAEMGSFLSRPAVHPSGGLFEPPGCLPEPYMCFWLLVQHENVELVCWGGVTLAGRIKSECPPFPSPGCAIGYGGHWGPRGVFFFTPARFFYFYGACILVCSVSCEQHNGDVVGIFFLCACGNATHELIKYIHELQDIMMNGIARHQKVGLRGFSTSCPFASPSIHNMKGNNKSHR